MTLASIAISRGIVSYCDELRKATHPDDAKLISFEIIKEGFPLSPEAWDIITTAIDDLRQSDAIHASFDSADESAASSLHTS